MSPASPEERHDFKIAVTALDQACLVHDDPADCEGGIVAHHVVYQQHLRAHHLHYLLWSPADGMTVCEGAHRRHHSGKQPIRRDRIPARCLRFAVKHDLTRYIDRFYA